MHTFEMKKTCFIKKNKVVDRIVKTSVDKATLIPLAHVTQLFFESDGSWIVRSQHLANVTYKIRNMFTKYASCTCGSAL
jgi:hypothetical protein